MPLFMDYHKFATITVEDVKNAHLADLEVQEKYGVKYLQFWVNQEAGTVFCLVEAPDEEACEAVHREAHGNIACAIVKVEPGFYELFMGKGHTMDPYGRVLNPDGSPDPANRNVMVVTIQGITYAKGPAEFKALKIPHEARRLVVRKITEFNGRKVDWVADDSLVSVFHSSSLAVRCAREIQKTIKERRSGDHNSDWNIIFKIGVSAGQPVTEKNDFFGEAIKLACRLSNLAGENEILLSSLANDLYLNEEIDNNNTPCPVKSLKAQDEEFITSLFTITEDKLSDEHFTLDTLSKDIGVSRPQLYRKIVSLTGKSPNDLVRDLRMNKAMTLLKKKSLNISQVAMEVGYNNPSYFSKCFSEKFGCTPSEFVVATGALTSG